MTLTFFFSDIEDSSGLADRLGGGYSAMLNEARELQRRAVADEGGPRGRRPRRRALRRLPGSRSGGGRGAGDPACVHGPHVAGGGARARTDRPAQRRGGGRRRRLRRHRRPPRVAHLPGRPRRTGPRLGGGGPSAPLGRARAWRIRVPRAEGAGADLPARRRRACRPSSRRCGTCASMIARSQAVIADDSALLREGLARLLEENGIDVVGQARNADELLLKVRSYHPDIAIVDIRMPPTQTDEGIRAAREIRTQSPGYGRARPLPARRAHLRDRAARRERGRARLPAEGPRRRRRRVHLRRPPGRRRRLRARPARRRRARRPQPCRRPDRAALAARARSARAHGRGPDESGDRPAAASSRLARSRSTSRTSSRSYVCRRPQPTIVACSPSSSSSARSRGPYECG